MTRDEVLAMEAEIRSGKRAVYRGHRVHFYPQPIPIRLDGDGAGDSPRAHREQGL